MYERARMRTGVVECMAANREKGVGGPRRMRTEWRKASSLEKRAGVEIELIYEILGSGSSSRRKSAQEPVVRYLLMAKPNILSGG